MMKNVVLVIIQVGEIALAKRNRKCLRCGKASGSELYCYLCMSGYPPSYMKSKRELEWEKRAWKRIAKYIKTIEGIVFNPSRRDNPSRHDT